MYHRSADFIRVGILFVAYLLAAALPLVAQRPGIWEPIGPSQATIFTIKADPFFPSALYSGTYFGGLYRSVDSGARWIAVPGPFSTYSVLSIEFDPKRRNIYYVGTFQHGLYGTRDGGVTWEQLNRGLKDIDIQSIAVDPFTPGRLVIATGTRVHHSNDNGETWQEIEQDVRARSLLADPQRPGVIYAATYSEGVWKSVDGGESFQQLGEGLEGTVVYSLEVDPVDQALLAGTSAGAFRLAKNATKWEDISYGQPKGSLTQIVRMPASGGYLAVSGTGIYINVKDESGKPYWFRISDIESRLAMPLPGSDFILFAGLHGDVFGTADGGKSFVDRSTGLQNAFVGALNMVKSAKGSTVLAGTDLGVYRLLPGETQWRRSEGFRQTVFELQPDPRQPGAAYAGTELNGVYRTPDEGKTWEPAADGIVPPEVYAIVQSTTPPFALFAATSGGVYRSLDNGGHWTQLSPLGNARAVALDPANAGNLLVGSDQGVVYLLTGETGVFSLLARPGIPREDVVSVATAAGDKHYAVLRDGTAHAVPVRGGAWFRLAENVQAKFTSVAVHPARANVILLGTSGQGLYRSTDFGVSFDPANEGLSGSWIFRIVADWLQEDVLYAATQNGVFRTADGGATWALLGHDLPAGPVLHVAVQGGGAGGVYASVLDRGVFRFEPRAQHWEPITEGLPHAREVVLAAHPLAGQILYSASLRNGIYRSEDDGGTWTSASRGVSLFVRGIAVDRDQPGRVFAASLSGGLFETDNGGTFWHPVGLDDRTLYKIALGQSSSTLYAATALGVSRSRDQGQTWEHLGQQTPFVYSLVAHPKDRMVVYLGSFAGEVYRSADGGLTWKKTGEGLPPADIVRLSIDGSTGTVYAAARLHGIYKSTDEGASWQRTGTIDGFTQQSAITGLCVDSKGAVYTAGPPVGAFRSLDGGTTWMAAIRGLRSLEVTMLGCGEEEVIAGALAEGIFVSRDQGASWFSLGPFPAQRVTAFAREKTGSTMFAGSESGVFIFRESERVWQRADDIPAKEVADIAVANGAVYAAVRGAGIYKSVDRGRSWQLLASGFRDALFTSLTSDGTVVYAGTQSEGFSRSADAGDTWSIAASPATVKPITVAIAVNLQDDRIVYAGTAGQGVLRSTDGGVTWRSITRGMDHLFILALTVDPYEPNTLYAGTNQGGVYVSNDAGDSWRQLPAGMYHRNVTSVAVDPLDHKLIYAGTEGGGVFRLQIP